METKLKLSFIIVISLSVAVICGGITFGDGIDSSKIYMKKASRFYEPSIQESLYREAIRTKADCAECYFELGKLFISIGEYPSALSELYFAREFNPELENLHYYFGYAYEMLNDFPEAIREYSLCIKKDKQLKILAEAHLSIGTIYDAMALPESSAVHYEEAIRLDSTSATAYYNLGISYDDRTLYKKAIECYYRAYQLDGTDSDALINMGVDYCKIGEFAKAIDIFKRALKQSPDNYKLNYNLANAYYLAGNLKSAKRLFEHTISIEPGKAESYYHLAQICEKLRDFKSAKENYAKFIKLASPIYEIAIQQVRQKLDSLKLR